MSSRARKVSEVIARLQENHNPDDIIAVNWWSVADFEGYQNTERALDIAQGYLDNINEHLTQYVAGEYEEEGASD